MTETTPDLSTSAEAVPASIPAKAAPPAEAIASADDDTAHHTIMQRIKDEVATEIAELRAWATAHGLAPDDHGVYDSGFVARFHCERDGRHP